MFMVCQHAKYVFCKYGKKCVQIHFTDICEENELCSEKYCDKRYPISFFYFKKYWKCKFGEYYSYNHQVKVEENLEKQVKKLKKRGLAFKNYCGNNAN